jgi:hypothetical protein
MDHVNLKLHAADGEDMQILSSYLQDGLLPLSSMHLDLKTGIFSCLFNRFCWEHVDDFEKFGFYYRIHTGFIAKNVTRLHTRNFDHLSPRRVLNLLTLRVFEEDCKTHIRLLFTHDLEIRLDVSSVSVLINDVESVWPTKNKPTHSDFQGDFQV